MFFQSPADAVASAEFSPAADLMPWRATRAEWHLATPGGHMVGVAGVPEAAKPIATAAVLRAELAAAADKDLRDKFESSSSSSVAAAGTRAAWQGLRPTDLLLAAVSYTHLTLPTIYSV